MFIREAIVVDIPGMHKIRIAVKENILPDPGMIPFIEYENYLKNYGKGWVCEMNNEIIGFAIVSIVHKNVWALFVKPDNEKQGAGRKLHDAMMNWYFSQTDETIWLGTSPQTRAENFYHKAGWKQKGARPNGEILFEMSKQDWLNLR